MARKLKYHAPNTDLRALERELAGSRDDVDDVGDVGDVVDDRPDEDHDEYSALAERYNADDDEVREDDWIPPKKQ